jgi:adenylyltransferase/sulfurtransferase
VDGAIQELMGIVRVFWPGRGANYESTLSERDYQIIGLRYSCPLLARDNILQGKVPTTPTSASIVAAFQTQEALKLIHDLEVEPGVALIINGLTNDVYKTEYPIIKSRLQEPLDPIVPCPELSQQSTLNDLLAAARQHAGEEAVVEFSHEIVLSMTDVTTGESESVFKRMASLTEVALNSPTTGIQREMTLTHRLAGDEDYLERTLAEFDLPPLSIVRARSEDTSVYLEMTGDKETFFRFH